MNPLRWLQLPERVTGQALDDPATTLRHAQIIWNKRFLRELYSDFYRVFKKVADAAPQGAYLELGSGGGFLKGVLPGVITSDVLPLPNVDRCCSAEALPFEDNSLDGIFMLDTFHHLPHPATALREFSRVLRPGGRIVMIEPANTAWGRFVYRHLHHEPFHPEGEWEFSSSGPLSGANGALPWIVFVRDRAEFERTIPCLKVKRVTCHTPFRYLIGGGLSYRSMAPWWSHAFFRGMEGALRPFNGLIGMFMTVEVEKVAAP